MADENTVGPPQLVINQGDTILVTDNDGQIPWPSDKGLYFLDTRLISSWKIFANGAPFDLLNSGAITHYGARVYLTNPVIGTEQGDIPEHTLALVLSRSLDGGVHEDIDITNQGMKSIRFNLEIAARSDFADIFEVKAKHIIRRGNIATEWSADTAQLRTTYRNKDFGREVNIRIANNDAQAVYANGRLSFEIDLAPGASWHSCVLYELGGGKLQFEAPKECVEYCGQSRVGTKAADWKRRVLKIRTTNEEFYRLFDQAVDDIAALRRPLEGTDHLASACGRASCRPSAPNGSLQECSHEICAAAGAFAPFPRITRLTTRIPTRTARSGHTTTALSRLVSGGMALQRRQHASRAKSAALAAISRSTGCPNSIPESNAPKQTSRCSISAPMCRKPGPLARRSPSSRQFLVCSRMLRAASFM